MSQQTLTKPATAAHLSAVADAGRWYALCGPRLYCVETLAGTFPDMGWHEPGEMGGIWAPPIKLLDGYWIGLRRPGHPQDATSWLDTPHTWALSDAGATFTYDLPTLNVRAERRAWIVPDESVLVVDLFLSPLSPRSPLSPPTELEMTTLEVVFTARSDLRGAWRSEEVGLNDGDDLASFASHLGAVILRDALHPAWSVCIGATIAPFAHTAGPDVWGPARTTGRGTGAALWYRCPLTPHSASSDTSTALRPSLRVVIAGPPRGEQPASALFARLVEHPAGNGHGATSAHAQTVLDEAHLAAARRHREPLEQCVLHSPEGVIDEAFAWSKATARWHMLEVPGLGRAPMGGIADFPWWFGCDTAFGVLALLPSGAGTEAADSLRTLARLSQQRNGNGRVIHEIVSNGVVIGDGNLVEVPLLARALYHTYRWTGDRALLEEVFPFCLRGVLDYALGSERQSGEAVPQGRSMVETPDMHGGVQTLDVGAYLVEALDLLGALAHDLGRRHLAEDLRARATHIRDTMRAEWWMPAERLFGDMRASADELAALLARLEAIPHPDESVRLSLQRLRGALAEPNTSSASSTPYEPRDASLGRQVWNFGHFTSVLAAEAGLPTADQAEHLLARLETPEWTTPFGTVLNSLSDRRVMTLGTGAMATAEARYGRADAALSYVRRLAETMGQATPGTMSEFSPSGGCFLQFWSSYGVIWPLVHAIFGLRPDVAARRLCCVPNLPREWPEARLDAIPLGKARFDLAVRTTAWGTTVRLRTDDPSWEVTLGTLVPVGATIRSATLNGVPVVLSPAQASGDMLASVAFSAPTWTGPTTTGAHDYTLDVVWAPGRAGRPHTAGTADMESFTTTGAIGATGDRQNAYVGVGVDHAANQRP